jgi:hypothetical protein
MKFTQQETIGVFDNFSQSPQAATTTTLHPYKSSFFIIMLHDAIKFVQITNDLSNIILFLTSLALTE